MKIYLAYDKKTKIYKGNEFSEEAIKRKTKIKPEYKNCEVLEIEESEWRAFIETNPEIIKIEAGKLKSEKRVRSLEELKNNALNVRNAFLNQTATEWGGAWEVCPQETLDKRKKARDEKKEIKAITTKEELEQWRQTKGRE